MKKKRYSPDKDLPFLTIEATLNAGTAALGVQPGKTYLFGENGKKNRKHGPDGQTITAVFTDFPPEDGAAETCRCHMTVFRDAGEWLRVPQSSFFRYKDALTERCLSLASETLGFDLISRLTGIKSISPPESDPETLARYGEPMQKLADKLFPKTQRMRITEIRETGNVPVLRLEKTDGFTAAPFHPGQFIMISPADSSGAVPVPFLFCSSPAGAQEGYYLVAPAPTVQPAGAFPWEEGEIVCAGPPQGDCYYSPLLNKRTVIGLTDASGAGAFLSMGYAIRDGFDKFKLTVIYLEQSERDLPFAEEFKALREKIPLQLVPAEDTVDPFHSGFLRKHLPHEAYSVFICGSGRLHEQAETALDRLRLPEKAIRIDPASFSEGQKAELIR